MKTLRTYVQRVKGSSLEECNEVINLIRLPAGAKIVSVETIDDITEHIYKIRYVTEIDRISGDDKLIQLVEPVDKCPEGYVEVKRKELVELSVEEIQNLLDGEDVGIEIIGAWKPPIQIIIRKKDE